MFTNPLWEEPFNIAAGGNKYFEKGNMKILSITFFLILFLLFPRAGAAQEQIVRISFVGDIIPDSAIGQISIA
ncbi:MAG: hypothetical protein BWX99_01897 [Deltaproteobacteria bacterium ADurb.Bin151]|nr:MAG: hypothetical protein BWX99_01897 [Deltaproteobacteria bacterium ADurb.Bin151]